jgi:adenylate cyclase class 2
LDCGDSSPLWIGGKSGDSSPHSKLLASGAVRFEVEQKFPIADLADVQRRLETLGAKFEPPIEQVDCYLKHPARDFAMTDEALRIRRVGDERFITYKGPKVDPTTKTRREIELSLGNTATADAWQEIFNLLGFKPVGEVHKTRRNTTIQWQGSEIKVSLDEVPPLGEFVELEIDAEAADVQNARECLAALARELELGTGERRSYLELLLGKTHPPSAVG